MKQGEAQIEIALAEVDRFAGDLDAEAQRYWTLHRKRFQWIAAWVGGQVKGLSDFRILDIGNSFQTVLIAKSYPYSQLDTLGYYDHRFPAGERSRHIEMDLNDAAFEERWPKRSGGGYDAIVFSEVIEHLYTSPEQVLQCLKSLLNPEGSLLIQTPNAAALKKRLKLLSGKNPYELIRLDRSNPGHFRELTVADLRRYAKLCGFRVDSVRMDSDLVDGKRFDRFCDRVSRYLPGSLKSGISICLKPLP